MATEKQIRANRENDKRSTGPKTVAGRMKSSRNALRHGFSRELRYDKITISKIEAIAQWAVPDQMDSMRVTAAAEAAFAQLDLSRVRGVRNQMMTELEQTAGTVLQVRRLAALERYERLALGKRRRALAAFRRDFRWEDH